MVCRRCGEVTGDTVVIYRCATPPLTACIARHAKAPEPDISAAFSQMAICKTAVYEKCLAFQTRIGHNIPCACTQSGRYASSEHCHRGEPMRAESAAICKPVVGVVLPAAWRLPTHTPLAWRNPAASSAAACPLTDAAGQVGSWAAACTGRETLYA